MGAFEGWDKFTATGSVYDYLAYISAERRLKERNTGEIHDRRLDNKGKQCR